MNKSKSDSVNSRSTESNKNPTKNHQLSHDKLIDELALNISKLSYEDSLQELDNILNQLQNETFLVEELQFNYCKAQLYLEHCDKLLDTIEQEVIEINTDDN